ncbi:hypothetical protein ACVIQY_002364 [Bradyrhizobium sp. USDA 3051]
MSRAGSTAATDSDRRHERMVPRTLKGRTANPKGEQDSRRGAPFLPRTARAVSAIVPLTVADLDVAMCVATVTRPRSAIRSNPTRPTAWRQCARIPAPNPFRCREGIAQSAANKCLLALFRAWLICLFEAIYAVCAMPLPCPRCPLTMAPPPNDGRRGPFEGVGLCGERRDGPLQIHFTSRIPVYFVRVGTEKRCAKWRTSSGNRDSLWVGTPGARTRLDRLLHRGRR